MAPNYESEGRTFESFRARHFPHGGIMTWEKQAGPSGSAFFIRDTIKASGRTILLCWRDEGRTCPSPAVSLGQLLVMGRRTDLERTVAPQDAMYHLPPLNRLHWMRGSSQMTEAAARTAMPATMLASSIAMVFAWRSISCAT